MGYGKMAGIYVTVGIGAVLGRELFVMQNMFN